MFAGTWLIVGAGIAMSLLFGLALGLDVTALVILVSIVAVGAMAVAAAGKARRREAGPARCERCGGLISPNAPYCKHCRAPVGPVSD